MLELGSKPIPVCSNFPMVDGPTQALRTGTAMDYHSCLRVWAMNCVSCLGDHARVTSGIKTDNVLRWIDNILFVPVLVLSR